jgi:hypothetical protein
LSELCLLLQIPTRYELVVEDESAQKALEGFLAQHPEVRVAPLGRQPWETEAFLEDLVRIAEDTSPENRIALEELRIELRPTSGPIA